MSQRQAPDTNVVAIPSNWRERLKEVGKETYIREEMERLGFWPPKEGVSEQALEAEAKLKILYKELQAARLELREINAKLNLAGDIPALIREIRQIRIERVRTEREARKQERQRLREIRTQEDREWRKETLPYLGHGVSAGLRYEGGEPVKLEEQGLPALQTAADVADAIGITTQELAWLTYHRSAARQDHYTRFTIPKRSGGTRVISAPKRKLRTAQTWVLNRLLVSLPVHEAAMAFRPGRSIVTNALPHVGQQIVVRMDLKDFFPSIRFRRVKGLFQHLGYNEGVASILALLCTEAPRVAATLDGVKRYVALGERQLPQGACTSPAITNLLCRRLDARLTGLAKAAGATYTRYADDLVFSHPDAARWTGHLMTTVQNILTEEGYVLNEEKTKVMRPQHRQVVTGVVVNEEPHLSRRDLRKFRAFLHHCETEGLLTMSEKIGKDALQYAGGYLAYLAMVCPEQASSIQSRYPWVSRYKPV